MLGAKYPVAGGKACKFQGYCSVWGKAGRFQGYCLVPEEMRVTYCRTIMDNLQENLWDYCKENVGNLWEQLLFEFCRDSQKTHATCLDPIHKKTKTEC